jgi:hypothetical protein
MQCIGGAVTWNLRDYHMFETLQDLIRYSFTSLLHMYAVHHVRLTRCCCCYYCCRYHEQRGQRATGGDQKSSLPPSSSSSSKESAPKSSTSTATPSSPPKVRCIIWAHNTHIHDARACTSTIE